MRPRPGLMSGVDQRLAVIRTRTAVSRYCRHPVPGAIGPVLTPWVDDGGVDHGANPRGGGYIRQRRRGGWGSRRWQAGTGSGRGQGSDLGGDSRSTRYPGNGPRGDPAGTRGDDPMADLVATRTPRRSANRSPHRARGGSGFDPPSGSASGSASGRGRVATRARRRRWGLGSRDGGRAGDTQGSAGSGISAGNGRCASVLGTWGGFEPHSRRGRACGFDRAGGSG